MATEYKIAIDQGSRYQLRIQLISNWIGDYTPYTPHMQVRKNATDGTPIVDLSAYLTLLPTNNQLVLDVGSDVSTAWSWVGDGTSTYLYSIELNHNSDQSKNARALQGTFTVDREVTR